MNEVRKRTERDERVLVTTLTKKMSEDLSQYLLEMGFKTRYLHSEIDTLERIQIIRDLRLGEYDVLVGVNLLREGLDLPEVSLVAILDADKEGFLRGETSLIQTIGRAARNVDGTVLMYADKETKAMKAAISETDRRREIQVAYNEQHGITAATIVKGISDIAEFLQAESKVPRRKRARRKSASAGEMPKHELERMVVELEEEMAAAADELRFEYAAQLRDELRELRRDLREIQASEARRTPTMLPQSPTQTAPRDGRSQTRPRRATSPRMRAVDIDRQAIERRDFPISRRGYEPAAVDAHLRALAGEIEQLQRELSEDGPQASLASTAGTQVQSILAAAEATAADLERDALDGARTTREEADRDAASTREEAIAQARAHVAAVAQATAVLLERVSSMDAQVGALVDSVRAGAGRLASDLSAVEANMGELYDAASGQTVTRAVAGEPASRPRSHAAARHAVRQRRRRHAGARAAHRRRPPRSRPRRSRPEVASRTCTSTPRRRAHASPEAARRAGAGERRPRRRAPDRAEHGAERRVARGRRPLSGRELPARRPRQADRRGLRRDRGVGRRGAARGCVLGRSPTK